MYKNRLLRMADLLERDAQNPKGVQFDIRNWGEVREPDNPMSCGTTACAMGLAALSKTFEAEGLWAVIPSRGRIDIHYKDKCRDGYKSAQHLFKISHQTAVWLFSPQTYRGEMTGAVGEMKVARRIKRLVAGTVAAR